MNNTFPSLNEQLDLISRGADEIIPVEELVKKIEKSIETKTQLRIKLGADPSRPDLHIGHAVVLQKLRDFQDLGHKAILIIGDFTAMIGDPSGRSKTRPPLTLEDTRVNGQSYFEQAGRVLSKDNIEIRYNSEWLDKMSFTDVIKLSSNYTVSQMLERDDFHKRFEGETPISLHEFLYPLAQGKDSVAIESDVELGGTDQKFNLLVGRELQRANGMAPQVIMTFPLLVGIDGVEKMSKSLGNYIAFTDTPQDMFGKTLSIPDSAMYTFYKLALFKNDIDLKEIQDKLKSGELHPRESKRELARGITARYYSAEEAMNAQEEFDKIFIKKEVPEDIESFIVKNPILILDLIVDAKLSASKGEARRLIQGGGVTLNGEKINDINFMFDGIKESILKIGKRKFLKLTIN